jgi:hypothetical protein
MNIGPKPKRESAVNKDLVNLNLNFIDNEVKSFTNVKKTFRPTPKSLKQ